MSDIDYSEIARRMFQRVKEARAFRIEHGPSMPGLMDAEDDYRNGGPMEDFHAAIEQACRERPELEERIRHLFDWAYYDGATDELDA